MHQMVENGVSTQEISPFIKMAHAFEDASNYAFKYSADSEFTSE